MKQQSVDSLPAHQQDAAMDANDRAVAHYPSVLLSTGQRLHVFKNDNGSWDVWLNCEDMDFTGICVAVGASRQEAITDAVRAFEAAAEELQQPWLSKGDPNAEVE